MNVLGLDIGSSSVKAAVLHGDRAATKIVRETFPTRHTDVRAEVDGNRLLKAVAVAIGKLGAPARRADLVALSVMSPAWVAMDADGQPLTPIVTHQDRRSVDVAIELRTWYGVVVVATIVI